MDCKIVDNYLIIDNPSSVLDFKHLPEDIDAEIDTVFGVNIRKVVGKLIIRNLDYISEGQLINFEDCAQATTIIDSKLHGFEIGLVKNPPKQIIVKYPPEDPLYCHIFKQCDIKQGYKCLPENCEIIVNNAVGSLIRYNGEQWGEALKQLATKKVVTYIIRDRELLPYDKVCAELLSLRSLHYIAIMDRSDHPNAKILAEIANILNTHIEHKTLSSIFKCKKQLTRILKK